MSFWTTTMGTSGSLAPKAKRLVGRHPNGMTVVVVPDTNSASLHGEDTTGTMKFRIYGSNGTTRTSYTLLTTYTPAVAAASGTRLFVGSMAMGQDGTIWLAFAGTDESLRMVSIPWNGSSYGTAVPQTILSGNSVTNRFRAIDIDVQWSGTASINPAVAVYEARASDSLGNNAAVYIRRNDGTTWIKAFEDATNTTRYIRNFSEDVAVCWGRDGIVTNVGRFAFFYTRTTTTNDSGDVVRELSYNVSAGTAGSATDIGIWLLNLNAGVAAGTRRGFLFGYTTSGGNPNWVFGTAVGISAPFFAGYKLHHNLFTGVVANKTIVTPSNAASAGFSIKVGNTYSAYVTANFGDEALEFSYSGVGIARPYAVRSVVIKFPAAGGDTAEGIDAVARVRDDNYLTTLLGGTPVPGVYGGSNSFPMGSLFEMTLGMMYGSSVGTPLFDDWPFQIGSESVLSPPSIVFPSGNPATTNRVTFQLQARNGSLYANVNGLAQVQVASDTGFTSDMVTLTESLPYSSYTSSDGITAPTRYINLQLAEADSLHTGTWYARTRMLDDFGGVSDWSPTRTFLIQHPPAAIPILPVEGSSVRYSEGDVQFSWDISDPEPTDAQSAYRLVILRTDTGASVLDTAKVASAAHITTRSISSSLKDVPMSWSVALWDSDDAQGQFSVPVNFVMSDPPSVVVTSPVDGATVGTGLPTVAWTFAAGGTRTQKAYRVRIYDIDQSPDVIIGDSGWITSTGTSYTFTSQILLLGVNYRVEVQVRDSSDQSTSDTAIINGNPYFEGGVSGWTGSSCTVAQSVVRAHEGLASALLTPSAACNVRSSNFPATAGHEYNVSGWVYSVAGWNAVTIALDWRNAADANISTSTTSVSLGANAWTKISKAAVAPALTTSVRVVISMTGSPTSSDKLWVDEVLLEASPVEFITDWVQPDASATSVTTDKFKARVSWTDSGQDDDFVAWRVYRRYNKKASAELDVDNTRNTWVMVYETTDVQSSYDFYDYTAPLNRPVDYVVVQVIDRAGSILESDVADYSTVTLVGDRFYFVPAVPIGAIASFEASYVTDDSFDFEVEQETLHVIGRGRQVQYGDDLGYDGSYTIKLRNPATARQDREFIELLCSSRTGNVYIRSPFGDVIFAAFLTPSFKRMAGVGLSDMGDLTVPYLEVFEEETITRVA